MRSPQDEGIASPTASMPSVAVRSPDLARRIGGISSGIMTAARDLFRGPETSLEHAAGRQLVLAGDPSGSEIGRSG